MVDVAVSAQLQQWSFEKPVQVRPERSASSASSPDLSHHEPETLRIDAASVEDSQTLASKESLSLQERYLSSEEDLSPMEGSGSESEYDGDDVSIHEAQTECLSARRMSISRWDKGKSCDMAVTVSYVSAGRPKMIDLANIGSPMPGRETAQRSASLALLPIAAISKLRKAEQQRHSLGVSTSSSRSISPGTTLEQRRPSTGHAAPLSHNSSSLNVSDSSSFKTASSIRSTSPSSSENSIRPVSAAAISYTQPRSSLYVVSNVNKNAPSLAPFPPLTPQSPPHSFLSSDPYENSTTNAASPIIKQAPHKRLRSISQKLSLAKIAITPSTKKWDSRINGKVGGNMPPTPATPYTPLTPQTAPVTSSSSSPMKLRRNSRISRPTTARGPSPETPPVPTLQPAPLPRRQQTQSMQPKKMVARGADEREPMLELPPFPVDDGGSASSSLKSRRIRKRKSLMDLL